MISQLTWPLTCCKANKSATHVLDRPKIFVPYKFIMIFLKHNLSKICWSHSTSNFQTEIERLEVRQGGKAWWLEKGSVGMVNCGICNYVGGNCGCINIMRFKSLVLHFLLKKILFLRLPYSHGFWRWIVVTLAPTLSCHFVNFVCQSFASIFLCPTLLLHFLITLGVIV